MIEGNKFIVIGGHTIFIWEASSVEVEYSALVCKNNNSRVCISVTVISRIPTISVCSLRVLGGKTTASPASSLAFMLASWRIYAAQMYMA